jgi:hypothetical protein
MRTGRAAIVAQLNLKQTLQALLVSPHVRELAVGARFFLAGKMSDMRSQATAGG